VEQRLEQALREAIAFLEAHGYRYAVIGGIAVTTWGIIRATRDVDLKVLVPDLDYASARAAIRAAFPEPGRLHAPDNPLIVSANIKGIVVDFLLALPGYEEHIVTRFSITPSRTASPPYTKKQAERHNEHTRNRPLHCRPLPHPPD